MKSEKSQTLCTKEDEAELMRILNIKDLAEISIIRWESPATPPQDARYIILKYYDKVMDEITFETAAYENLVYSIPVGDGTWRDIPKHAVLGWSYPMAAPAGRKVTKLSR